MWKIVSYYPCINRSALKGILCGCVLIISMSFTMYGAILLSGQIIIAFPLNIESLLIISSMSDCSGNRYIELNVFQFNCRASTVNAFLSGQVLTNVQVQLSVPSRCEEAYL